MVLIFSVEMWLGVEPLGKVPPGGAVGMAAEMVLRGRTGGAERCVAVLDFERAGKGSQLFLASFLLGEALFDGC